MTITLIIPTNNRNIQETLEDFKNIYKMEFPTHIHLTLSDKLIDKMKNIQKMMVDNNLITIETFSSYSSEPDEDSFATLYKNGELLKISQYSDFGKLWDTVDLQAFKLRCEFIHSNKFMAEFIFTTGYCYEFVLQTQYFDIE